MSTQTTRKGLRETKRAERRCQQVWGRVAWSLVGLVGVVIVGYILWGIFRPKPGQSVPQLSRTHIQVDDPHEPYNSDPPTSGPRAAPVEAGFYDEAPPDEQLVHNLEHGYVIIWYNCQRSPSGDGALTTGQCSQLQQQIRDGGGARRQLDPHRHAQTHRRPAPHARYPTGAHHLGTAG